MLEGRCQMMIGDETLEARKYDAILVPPEHDRSYNNHTDQDCWLLVVGAPPGEFRPEGFAAYLAANGFPEDTQLVTISTSRFEIVG